MVSGNKSLYNLPLLQAGFNLRLETRVSSQGFMKKKRISSFVKPSSLSFNVVKGISNDELDCYFL